MRCLVGFVFVLALGVMPLVGCREVPPECRVAGDCDDQNACTDDKCNARSCDYIPNDALCDFDGLDDFYGGLDGICISGVCEENPCDDGNECTYDLSPASDGSCFGAPGCTGCQPCERNGEPGICDGDVCAEYPCNDGVLCTDGDPCTRDWCNTDTGACYSFPRCEDHDVCTDAACDPETGECDYIPAVGRSCCLEYSGCGGICISPPCDCRCVLHGRCDENGECV